MHRLTATATDSGPKGRDDAYGHGRLDLVKALTADVPAMTPSSLPSQATAPPAAAAGAGSPRNQIIAAVAVAVLVVTLLCVALAVMLARRRT